MSQRERLSATFIARKGPLQIRGGNLEKRFIPEEVKAVLSEIGKEEEASEGKGHYKQSFNRGPLDMRYISQPQSS